MYAGNQYSNSIAQVTVKFADEEATFYPTTELGIRAILRDVECTKEAARVVIRRYRAECAQVVEY